MIWLLRLLLLAAPAVAEPSLKRSDAVPARTIIKLAKDAMPRRQRLRRRPANASKVSEVLWKELRLLQERRSCSKNSDCAENDYCMSCTKCGEYHARLPKEQQRRWTCNPCNDGENICESGKYCTIAQDPVDSTCPSSYPGCSAHSDCLEDEYCFSCQKCEEYFEASGEDNNTIWRCQPCPTQRGGYCSKQWWCPERQDSITGSCPSTPGCSQHSDCKGGEFCEGCDLCLQFQASLPESQRAMWPCEPCPTSGGGICAPGRACQLANTGIDRTCPPEHGCNAHVQCMPDEYCMDCDKCNAYRDSLHPSQQQYWPCGYCPTGRGGHCERRVFCSVANDGVSDNCPLYEGCFKHEDCRGGEFCWSWKKCMEEDTGSTGSCGDKPRKDGFCNPISTCSSRRSIDGECRGAMACNSHRDCGQGLFCVLWSQCNWRSPAICGPRPLHRDGVCLPVEHCTQGFHPPLGGACPAWAAHNGTAGGQVEVAEVLKLNGSLMLASWGQAMDSWSSIRPHQERDLVIVQLHDYASDTTQLDDAEYVGIYEVTAGKMQERQKVSLSCPFVETVIPPHGSRIFEARIFMDEMEMSQKHAECSCILGAGRCPRGARYLVASVQPESPDYCESNPAAANEANSQKAVVPEHLLEKKRNCSGSIQVTTESSFRLESPGATVRFLRLDNFELEEVTIPEHGKNHLIFDGQYLRCEARDLEHWQGCGSLHRDLKIPVVLQHFTEGSDPSKNTISLSNYCISCKEALKRFHPVFFYDSTGQALRNSLSLYTMSEDLLRAAQLVDARKSLPMVGYVDSPLGCPKLEAETSKGMSLQDIRDKYALPKDGAGNVNDKWCVVQVGGCSMSSKVKFCVVGGAAGVIIMEAPGSQMPSVVPDKQGQVYLSEGETLNDLVPVLYSAYDEQLWQALMAQEAVHLEAGPNVSVRPANTHAVSAGGVRIYDALTRSWHFGGGDFGAQRWMEHSQVRDVLFVCTEEQLLIALDTSRSDSSDQLLTRLTRLGAAPQTLRCGRSTTSRDRHLIDFRRPAPRAPSCPPGINCEFLLGPSQGFVSLFIDSAGDRNHLIFFDTSQLGDWKMLSEVHANWEHATQGLGQVVVTQDSAMALITWHCSTLHCGSTRRTDDARPGERVYVLDLRELPRGYAPPVLAAVKVPMSPGSIIRDVQCTAELLCLVSLSWDGVAVIDLAEGPNRFKVIAEHSASFTGWATPYNAPLGDLTYLRMVVGAQKVVASRSRPRRFYIERWSFDMAEWNATGGDLSVRYDSVWAVDLTHYVRPPFSLASPPSYDPAVTGLLKMPKVSYQLVSDRPRAFEIKMLDGLEAALKIDDSRIKIASTREAAEGAVMEFTLLDGLGPAPETLFNSLFRQLLFPQSAIHQGTIKEEVNGATLERLGPVPISLQHRGRPARPYVDASDSFFRVLLVVCFILLSAFTIWLMVRSKTAMRKLKEENRRLKAERQAEILSANVPVGHATGYVIGRPEPSGAEKDPDAKDSAGSLSYVVGNPIETQVQAVQPNDEELPHEEAFTTVRAPTRPAGDELR